MAVISCRSHPLHSRLSTRVPNTEDSVCPSSFHLSSAVPAGLSFIAADAVSQWLTQQANAVGKADVVDPSFEWEKAFKRVIRSIAQKSGQHRNNPAILEDMFTDVMMKIDSHIIDNYNPDDPNARTFPVYILKYVQRRALDWLKKDHDVNRARAPTRW